MDVAEGRLYLDVSCILLVAHGWTMLCRICKVLATTDTTMCLCALLGQRLPSVTWHRPVWQSGLAIKIRCRQQKQVMRAGVYILSYLLTFYQTYTPTFYLTFYLAYIIIYHHISDILLWYSPLPIFWHSMWRFDLAFYPAFYMTFVLAVDLAFYLTFFWHSGILSFYVTFFLTLYLTFFPAFYLASILTFFLVFYVTSVLKFFLAFYLTFYL